MDQLGFDHVKAVHQAEEFVRSEDIDELETSAYAVVLTPDTTEIVKIAFRYDERRSAFNHSCCRVVIVTMDTLDVSWDTAKDQHITADMVPVAALLSGTSGMGNSSSSRRQTQSATGSALGSYLVLARTNSSASTVTPPPPLQHRPLPPIPPTPPTPHTMPSLMTISSHTI